MSPLFISCTQIGVKEVMVCYPEDKGFSLISSGREQSSCIIVGTDT
jgi:hypothetical protein